MGKRHAASGLAAGFLVARPLGLDFDEAALFSLLTAAYAVFPDLDHLQATATKLLGGFTALVSKILRRASAVVYERTKGPRDENWNGKHRHLSHTWIFAVAFGGVVAGLALISPWAMLPVALFGALCAGASLGDWAMGTTLLGMAALVPGLMDGTTDLTALSWLTGIAVAFGCAVHDVGDALTLGGCPFLWPLPLRGETWYEIRLLGPFSFRTDSFVEKSLVAPLLTGLTLLGMHQYASPYLAPIANQIAAHFT